MKFGKYLATRQLDLPEYADYFINYKQLKKLINRLAGKDPKAAHENLQAQKASFFFQLDRELEKVQTCYEEKETGLESRLTMLSNKLATAKKQGISHNSPHYIGLHEGILRFRHDLERLEEFVELNGTGFSKVLKKWDKRSRSHTKELFLRRAVEIQPMFNRDILGKMSDTANKLVIELEALNTGDSVYEPSPQPLASNPNDDLIDEFITFAENYEPKDKAFAVQMGEWRQRLAACAPPRLSYAFRVAISTKAKDEALMDLYSDDVKLDEIDEYSGKSCLHYAASAKEGRVPIVELAIKKQVSINLQDQYGKTALHYAVINKRHDIAKILLSAGANVDAMDNDNYAPLHYALFFNLPDIFQTLLNTGARVDGNSERDYIALNFACQCGAVECVGLYLEKFPKPNMVPDAEGLYPLHIASRAGFHQLVRPLVEAGADIDALDKLNSWTPLMYAATAGNSETVQLLLECNANCNILDERGYSAFFYACWQGHSRSILLLSHKLTAGTHDISRAANISAGVEPVNADSDGEDVMDFDLDEEELLDLDGIPALSLPPPIIPIQRYGHSFLDSEKVIIQVMFDSDGPSIQFNEDRKLLSAGRLTMSTSSSRDSITRNIDLPIREDQKVQTFQVEDLNKFLIDFAILPTFGTRVMVRSTALATLFTKDPIRTITLPLLNVLLQAIGVLTLKYLMVMPYSGRPLEITKFDTYWKSTSYIESTSVAYPRDHYHATSSVEAANVASYSVVTSTSLKGTYHRVPVAISCDGVVLVSKPINMLQGAELQMGSLRACDIKKLFPEIKTLREYLQDENTPAQLNIYIPYPSEQEISRPNCRFKTEHGFNETVDSILHVVFEHVRQHHDGGTLAKRFLFTSPNSDICTVLNWKQPNYPVLFVMNGLNTDGTYSSTNHFHTYSTNDHVHAVNYSSKEASRFAAQNNLMGVVLPGALLRMAPAIVQTVRVLGLVVIADIAEMHEIQGVDGISTSGTMTFFSG